VKVRTDVPRRVRTIDNVWIPVRDGARLAARIWLPEDAERKPVPAILEAIPYRKSDWTAARDAVRHPYVAGHGYACVRLDLRGSGDSDGIIEDEYPPQEQDDVCDAIAWLAAQPWCTGDVGMVGISWGGFNGLQVAARRPPALRAVVSLCSTDDRYADDVHYVGGSVLADQMLPWAAQMLVWNAQPSDPAVVGDRWRELWLERLERTPPFVETWLSHQRRDAYWRHGSVCEDFAAIEVPVYMVGGWADGYQSAVFRYLAGAPGVRKGLVGPWAHAFPEEGTPGPQIGWLQEALRWWDRWLKGIGTEIEREPVLRAWLQEPVAPATGYEVRPGRWVAEDEWPSPRLAAAGWYLARGALAAEPDREEWLEIAGVQSCGLGAGPWGAYGDGADLPPDQRADDGLSLVFDSAPLAERVEVLGFPELSLVVAADRPLAQVAVRLCDVARTGESLLVAVGVLNLTHREGHERPEPLEPGRPYEATVRLRACGHAFLPGHRIRVAVSPTYWPWLWPSPEPVTLSVLTGRSVLALPVRPPRPEDERLAPFAEPECSPPLAVEELAPGYSRRTVERDVAAGAVTLLCAYGGHRRIPGGMEIREDYSDTYSIAEGDPLSARVESTHAVGLARGAWRTRVETASAMWSDAERFFVTTTVVAYEGDEQVFERSRELAVLRDHV
jgi:hypothetical protein